MKMVKKNSIKYNNQKHYKIAFKNNTKANLKKNSRKSNVL